jgi:hypothetical protein
MPIENYPAIAAGKKYLLGPSISDLEYPAAV